MLSYLRGQRKFSTKSLEVCLLCMWIWKDFHCGNKQISHHEHHEPTLHFTRNSQQISVLTHPTFLMYNDLWCYGDNFWPLSRLSSSVDTSEFTATVRRPLAGATAPHTVFKSSNFLQTYLKVINSAFLWDRFLSLNRYQPHCLLQQFCWIWIFYRIWHFVEFNYFLNFGNCVHF